MLSFAPKAPRGASEPKWQRPGIWAIFLALALGTGWAVSGPFRSHDLWMYYEQDDFFYYLRVAENLARGKGSTFNGLVPTNGYHPLWMLVLAAVVRLGAESRGVFVFLAATIWIATMVTSGLALQLLRKSGVPSFLSALCAAFLAVYCMHLYVEGMEVTLAVPLMLAVIVALQAVEAWAAPGARGFLRSLCAGLLTSAMILARLDTVLFAGMLFAAIMMQPSLRRAVRLLQAAGLTLGLLPVAVYALVNRVYFGLWLPVSGVAKDLKLDHGFTGKAASSLFELSHTQLANLGGITLILFALPWLWKRLLPIERAIALPALLFPFVYFAVLSWMSDWRLWGWYFYSLRVALCVSLLALLRVPAVRRVADSKPFQIAFACLTLFRIATLVWDVQLRTTVDAGLDLQQFAATHHGVYAMGDRAGSPGYLLNDPIVQTEGLVMDRNFLRNIAAQRPLREVLRDYNVRYYVASSPVPYSGCFEAVEPWQAGPHAPHMRGEFCERPVAQWMHEGWRTMVFDLRP